MKRSGKKRYVYFLLVVLIFSLNGIPNAVKADEMVTIEGGQIIKERTLVPLRSIFEELGASVEWNQKLKKVKAIKGDKKVELTIGSNKTYINGSLVVIDVPAQNKNGQTLVPLRFVSEALGAEVKWDKDKRIATITQSNKKILVKVSDQKLTKQQALQIIDKASDAFKVLEVSSTKQGIINQLNTYFTDTFISNLFANRAIIYYPEEGGWLPLYRFTEGYTFDEFDHSFSTEMKHVNEKTIKISQTLISNTEGTLTTFLRTTLLSKTSVGWKVSKDQYEQIGYVE